MFTYLGMETLCSDDADHGAIVFRILSSYKLVKINRINRLITEYVDREGGQPI
jgi:hypothetical protein